jgi:hypothetical protein
MIRRATLPLVLAALAAGRAGAADPPHWSSASIP